jgi:prepilin-type processing-associated H-X9-DG protein
MKTSRQAFSETESAESDHDPQPDAAFSRIDLLTVICVFMLGAMVLTPALARTRVQDQAFACLNHLRQLMAGWQMYSEDNAGALPSSWSWVGGAMSYSADIPDNTNTYYLRTGLLGPYVKDLTAYKCPADRSTALEGGVRYPRVRTMSMSAMFRAWPSDGWAPCPPWSCYIKIADIVRPAPAGLWVLIEENPDSINEGIFNVSMNQGRSASWVNGPNMLHNGGCNFAFADGHGVTKRWQDPRTLEMMVTYTRSFPSGIRQPNNPDIQWVQDRTTAPQ